MGAGEVHIIALLEPITAVLIGVLFFSEHLATRQYLGIALALAGAVPATLSPAPSEAPRVETPVGDAVDMTSMKGYVNKKTPPFGTMEVSSHHFPKEQYLYVYPL